MSDSEEELEVYSRPVRSLVRPVHGKPSVLTSVSNSSSIQDEVVKKEIIDTPVVSPVIAPVENMIHSSIVVVRSARAEAEKLAKDSSTDTPTSTSVAAPTNVSDDEFDFDDEPSSSTLDEQSHSMVFTVSSSAAAAVSVPDQPVDFSDIDPTYAPRYHTPDANYVPDPTVVKASNDALGFLPASVAQEIAAEPIVIESVVGGGGQWIEDCQAALQSVSGIYANGMGDQEVVLLVAEENGSQQEQIAPLSGKLNDLGIICEEDEEDDDEEEDDVAPTRGYTAPLSRELTEEEKLWANIEKIQAKDEEEGQEKISKSELPTRRMSYTESKKFFETISLPEGELVISSGSSSSSGNWLKVFGSSKPVSLTLPADKLNFPVSLSMVSYDSGDDAHLAMLRHLYQQLRGVPPLQADLSPLDDRWELIGFQGRDPRTDLNRAIRMLSILQTLSLVDEHLPLARKYFASSASDLPRPVPTRGVMDHSWPFMCVSIMFSREALQALRSGELNSLINSRGDVMSVLNDFHRALFEYFLELLDDKTKHHAIHLATIREKCTKSPGKILKKLP